MLSRGHLDLAGISISLIRFFLNLCIPTQAIIAALSPQNFISGNIALNPISFERLRIFSSLPQKNHIELDDFFKTMSGAFSEPILFGKRLANNKEFQSLSGSFDIFHDNQSISKYPAFMHNKLITTVHHPIHIDRDLDLKFEQNLIVFFIFLIEKIINFNKI